MAFPTRTRHPVTTPTVLFDYGNVLSGPPDPGAWAGMCSLTSLPSDRLDRAYWQFRHDYDRATLTGIAYWRAVAAATNITLTDAQIARLFDLDVDLWTVPNQPLIDWAKRLQHAQVRTGILSNIGDCIAEGIVARLPWLAGFDHCTWSHALFMAKPEPAIYLRTAEALHTPPTDILFLDDKLENIEAAAALGMNTIQYTTHPAFLLEMRQHNLAWLLEVDLN